MKQYKKFITVLSAIALMALGTVQAQEKQQWFVGGGAEGAVALNDTWNKSLGARLSGGVWLNNYTGFRLNVRGGNMWLKDDYTATLLGGGVDWLVSLHKGGRNDDRRWNFNGVIGIGYEYYDFSEGYSTQYTHISTLNGYFGVQATYKLSNHLQLFAEPGVSMTPKAYDLDRDDDVFASTFINVGVIYKF